jgi:hypothetical protein
VAVPGVQCRASGPCGGAPSARRGPLSLTILPGHRGAHAGRHGAYQDYRPRRPPSAWRPQSMVRLPGTMAPSRELPAGVRGDAP